MEYIISEVRPEDRRTMEKTDRLLAEEGIRRDANLDYTCAMFDEDYNVVGTGSCFSNTLRCFAVSRDHQGEGLMNQLVSHLMRVQLDRGISHVFVYTKASAAVFFKDLGFSEIARTDNGIVFLENRRNGFSAYIDSINVQTGCQSAAVVMNANPFTNGHLMLIEKAAESFELVHVFVLSEDVSFFPFEVRKLLVEKGTAHLKNVRVHDSGPYMISNATFPSYFLKDDHAVIEGHAKLDIAVFKRIAGALGISARFAGEEPSSFVTGLYNRIMSEDLPKAGIEFFEIPRLEHNGRPVSAGLVRSLIHDGHIADVRGLVPASTYEYLTSSQAVPVIERIKEAADVLHY